MKGNTTETLTTVNEFLNRQLELLNQNPAVEPNPVFPGTGRTIEAVPRPRGEWDTRGENRYTRDHVADEYNGITVDEPGALNHVGNGILDATTTFLHDPQINNYANRIIYRQGVTPQQEGEERLNFLIEQVIGAFNPANTVNAQFTDIINNPAFIQIGDIVTPLMLQGRETLIHGMRQNVNLAELMQQVHAHVQAATRFHIGPIEFHRGFHRVNWGQTRINIEELINRADILMQEKN